MKELLYLLIPDSALIVVLVLIGFALILGIINTRKAFSFIGIVILYALLFPFIDSLFEGLPLWLLILLMIFFAISILSRILKTIVGKEATDQFTGRLLFSIFTLPFKFLRSIFRGARRRRII